MNGFGSVMKLAADRGARKRATRSTREEAK